jgi:hypothetical protein
MLLDKRADVNAQGGLYDNALQAASRRGHRNVAQILLDRGALQPVPASGGYGHEKGVPIKGLISKLKDERMAMPYTMMKGYVYILWQCPARAMNWWSSL